MRALPPTGYLEIEHALRLLEQGERPQAQAVLEITLLRLAGAADGRGLGWFRNAGL